MRIETVSPRTLSKKLMKRSSTRQDNLSIQPQQLCMFLQNNRTSHFVLIARLGQKQIQVIIDSGANRSYASIILTKALTYSIKEKDFPY